VRRVRQLGLLLAGIGLWALGVSQIQAGAIGSYGILANANPWYVLGLALLLGGALMELYRDKPSGWVLGGYLVGLIVAIHATVPVVYHGIPEYAWVYKHIGVAQQLGLYGRVTDTANIYQQWPALFAAVAAVSSLAGVTPLTFAAWAPLAFELADALLLLGVFRLLAGDRGTLAGRRLPWLALLLYEGLVAWVGQDYLSPQAFGFLLWLGIVTVVVRWLLAPAPAAGRIAVVARVRGFLLAGRPDPPAVSAAQRLLAVVLIAVAYFAIVAAHQLTPYLAIAAIVVLALLGVLWRGWLLALLFVVVAGGFLVPRYGLISHQFGGLFSGGDIFENASGVKGIARRAAEERTAQVVQLLAALMWLGAAAAIAARWRSLGRVAVPAVLAFSPFLMLGAQSYGGEAIYRVFMFSAPWCALLIAGLLLEPARAFAWRAALAAAACAVALAGGLQGLYGPVAVDAFTPAELAASRWLYGHAPPGSVLVLAADNFPALEVGDYASYDLQVIPADPQFGASWLDEASVPQVEQWIGSLGNGSAYVVFSRSMAEYASYFGYPTGYGQLANAVRGNSAWQLVYRNADVAIYRITV
jgi:hypothetical protein